MSSKTQARQLLRAQLKALSPSLKEHYSTLICQRLSTIIQRLSPSYLIAFLPMAHEPMITPLIQQGLDHNISVYVPRYLDDSYTLAPLSDLSSVQPGRYDILEPSLEQNNLALLDESTYLDPKAIWLVPGIGFSTSGHRLGHGKGIYDELLKNAKGLKLGLCFSCQLTLSWGPEPHDVPVHYIVTETSLTQTNAYTRAFPQLT